jgi:hypothetical protein
MAKQKKPAKKKSAGKGKGETPASAAEIKKLEAEAKAAQAKPEPVEIPELTRSIQEIMNDRVKIAPGHIGMTLDDETPIEENLAILDYTMTLSDHVGFMIGDVLNSGFVAWGDKYKHVLNQTGKAMSTLKGYSEVSRRIPIDKRVAALPFSHHREIVRLPEGKMEKVLEDLEKESEKKDGYIPTVVELRMKVQSSLPRKNKRKGKPTSGSRPKGKGAKKTVELPPYEMTDVEEQLLEEAEMAVEETAKLLKPDGKVEKVLKQLDNKTKQRWLSKLDGIVLFFKNVQNTVGY